MAFKNRFFLYNDQFSMLEKLTNEERGMVLTAIYAFVLEDVLPTMTPLADLAATAFISRLEADEEAYAARCTTNAKNIAQRYNKANYQK